jgi:hypothetical protein
VNYTEYLSVPTLSEMVDRPIAMALKKPFQVKTENDQFKAALEKAFMELLRSIDLSDLQDGPKKTAPVIEAKYDDPVKQAEYAYSLIEIDDFAYLTKKLKKLLMEAPPVFDGEFMKSVVRRITVCGDKAEFELINGKTYGKELNLGAADGKKRVGHTGAKKYTPRGGGQCQA